MVFSHMTLYFKEQFTELGNANLETFPMISCHFVSLDPSVRNMYLHNISPAVKSNSFGKVVIGCPLTGEAFPHFPSFMCSSSPYCETTLSPPLGGLEGLAEVISIESQEHHLAQSKPSACVNYH